MNKLTRDDLYSLEKYSEVRPEFRARVMAHKKNRRLPIGPNAALYFEDALTMHYQIQEMLRAERIFEASGIQEELDAYNPLIPDGSNWKATFMMEYPDEDERRVQLAKLIGIERHVWAQVADFARITPVADEDLERETEEKTSSVHFLRFELTAEMVAAVKAGSPISIGIDHPAYTYAAEPVAQNIRDSLAADLT
ncbi:MAG: DUF3501 family protein [Gammaproteobacteria bacterium]|nr:DUF3501 family protein [Gammaproteobacteria bacterium]